MSNTIHRMIVLLQFIDPAITKQLDIRELIPVIVKIKPARLQQNLYTKFCHHALIAKFACGYISVVIYSQKLKQNGCQY